MNISNKVPGSAKSVERWQQRLATQHSSLKSAQSRFSRIAIVDTTAVAERANTADFIESLVNVPGVDSAAARDLARMSYEGHSLKGIARLRLRMPVLLLDHRTLASLPRKDLSIGANFTAVPWH